MLAEAGINLEIEPMEIGAYVDRWLAADFDTAVALEDFSASVARGNDQPVGVVALIRAPCTPAVTPWPTPF